VRFHDRTWNEYKRGFGNLSTEFWIGKSIKLNWNSRSSIQTILIVTIWTLLFKLEKNPHYLCTSIDTKFFFVECHCSPFRMMTYFYSLNSKNMFQVLTNFTSSLETSNANFALNSQLMMIVLLGQNISGYWNCIMASFSNFAHFTLLNSRSYFTPRVLWLDVTSLRKVCGQGSQIGPFRPNFRNLGLSPVGWG